MLAGAGGAVLAAVLFARSAAGFSFTAVRAGFAGGGLGLARLISAGALLGAALVRARRQEKGRGEDYRFKSDGFHG